MHSIGNARRLEAAQSLPWVGRNTVVIGLLAAIMAGEWPPAEVDTAAKADSAGSEWTQ